MAKKSEHGERNISLSEDLRKGNVYFDWSVTTAFYSAIQFVEHKIFPFKEEHVTISNLNEARKFFGCKGRHQTREFLVEKILGRSIGIKYKWLENKSRTARYVSFKTNVSEAEKAIQYCKEIREACIK